MKNLPSVFSDAMKIALVSLLQFLILTNALELKSFRSCCQVGIDEGKTVDASKFSSSVHSELDECSTVNRTIEISLRGKSLDDELTKEIETECDIVARGCFLTARTKKFCSEQIPVSNKNFTFDISRTMFDVPMTCCMTQKALPFYTLLSNGVLSMEAGKFPSCCEYEEEEETFPDPFADLDENETYIANPKSKPTLLHVESPPPLKSDSNLTQLDRTNLPEAAEVNATTENLPVVNSKNKRENMTVVCENGFIWDAEKRLCMHVKSKCPLGMYMSSKKNMCFSREGLADSCPPGYELRDESLECEDVNECAEGVLHENNFVEVCTDASQACENLPGSYKCSCQPGYNMSASGECIDIDECVSDPYSCRPGYKCRNVLGSYQCIREVPCGFGYVLNTETQECEDIDECKTQPNICGANMICVNVRGGLKCVKEKCPGKQRRNSHGICAPCPSGYDFNENISSCEDIDECALNQTLCRAFEKCVNRPGDYICEPKIRCPWGMQLNLDGTGCEDVDECQTQNFKCQLREICVNTVGSYYCADSPCHFTEIYNYEKRQCTCEPGYTHMNNECIDIDECAVYESESNKKRSICSDGKTCVNIPGSYRCVNINDCPRGFRRSSIREPCTDVNECLEGTAKCGPTMRCENTVGSYRCLCEPGYKNVNETTCVDIDECKIFRADESCPDPRARCVNTAGSYECICPDGFVWMGYPISACKDIDECESGTDRCGNNHLCINEIGGYRCQCSVGYTLAWDEKSCIDVDECSQKGRQTCLTGICVNTVGGFRCDCPTGYRLGSDDQCVDVDECTEKDDICEPLQSRSLPPQACVNLHGGYRCVSQQCPSLYSKVILPDGYRCNLRSQYTCPMNDLTCMNDRPLRIENHHIELVTPFEPGRVLGKIDTTLVTNGTVHVELLEHYSHNLRNNAYLPVKNALKLRLGQSSNRFIELVLVKELDAPADILVSVRLAVVVGRLHIIRSTTKFYLYVTDTAQSQARFERQHKSLMRQRQ